jgi:uncharacterized membrane protein YfcA
MILDLIAEIGLGAWLFCLVSVTVGTVLQRLAGQGFGMVAAPMVALVAPQMLPAALLLLGLFVGLSAFRADFGAVNLRELPPGFAGRTLGAIIAALIAAQLVETDHLGFAIACIVFVAIGLSLVGLRVAIRPISLFLAGTTAGIMGTLTAIGAPPMALLYQHEERARSAAMQNTYFMFGMAVSLSALTWQGLIHQRAVLFALMLAPGVPIGLVLTPVLASRLKGYPMRPIALGLAGTSATTLLLKSLY